MRDIAIIGAGMAGLACATRLKEQGRSVTVFDKGRGPGGRMATRRAQVAGDTVSFDHGAQYFTVRDTGFAEAVAGWRHADVVAPWPAAGDDAMVGIPSMNAPIRHMAAALEVHWTTRIEAIERSEDGWRVVFEDGSGRDGGASDFRQVIIAVPAEQAMPMLSAIELPVAADWSARARASTSSPCWAVMATFSHTLPLADTFRGTEITWAARNSAKPGREAGEHWVIHGSSEWSAHHLELDPEQAGEALLERFCAETDVAETRPLHLAAHRWRFAKAQTAGRSKQAGFLWDAPSGLGVCGDWLASPRVEGAWVSGNGLARAVAS